MSAISTPNGMEHSAVWVYVFGCTYPNISTKWQDEPTELMSIMRTAFNNISGLTYTVLKVSNVRNADGVKLEIHIDGMKWNDSDRLSSSEVDALRTAIRNKINTVNNFTYSAVDVVCDRFLDNPTSLWTTSFEIKEGWT
jgi:hypothetical protein